MTETQAALVALLDAPTDPAFDREWRDRGGHAQTCPGDPVKQDQWKRELPLKAVIYTQVAREDQTR